MFRASRLHRLDLAILIISLGGSLLLVALSDWNGQWLVENGPFEMLQNGALLAATILFLRASLGLKSWAGRLAIALCCMSLLFLVRELPRCASPFYEAGVCLPGDTKTFAYLLPAPLAVALVFANPAMRAGAFMRTEWSTLARFIWRCLPLLVVVPPLGIAQIADGRGLPLVEEALELAAYGIMALAGLAAAQERDRLSTGEGRSRSTNVWATT